MQSVSRMPVEQNHQMCTCVQPRGPLQWLHIHVHEEIQHPTSWNSAIQPTKQGKPTNQLANELTCSQLTSQPCTNQPNPPASQLANQRPTRQPTNQPTNNEPKIQPTNQQRTNQPTTGGSSPQFGFVSPPPPPRLCPPGPLSYQGSIATDHTYGSAKGTRKIFLFPLRT